MPLTLWDSVSDDDNIRVLHDTSVDVPPSSFRETDFFRWTGENVLFRQVENQSKCLHLVVCISMKEGIH